MALNWDVSKIANHERVTTSPIRCEGRLQWHPATESLVWLSLHCGFSSITEKNAAEVADRVRIWQHYFGAQYSNQRGELKLSLEDIHDHIGLSTNASTLTTREFWDKVRRIMEREARLGSTRIDMQVRRVSCETQVSDIEAELRRIEGVPDDIDLPDQIWHWFESAEDISIPQQEIAAQIAQTLVHT